MAVATLSGQMILSRLFYFGTIVGVPLHVHPIAALLCPLAVMPCAIRDPVAALGLMIVLGASILAHETGHALAAKSLGLRVEAIHYYGIAGLCAFEDPGGDARRLCVVAAAGPLVNLAIALVLLPLALSLPDLPGHPHSVSVVGGAFVINTVMCVGNLLPMFPLDGSQILFALLWRKWPDRRAVVATAGTGIILAGPAALVSVAIFAAGFPCGVPALMGLNWSILKRAWRNRDYSPAADLRSLDVLFPGRPPRVSEADRLMADILAEQRRRNARPKKAARGPEPSTGPVS